MSGRQAKAVRSLAEPIVARLECDLEDVQVRPAGRRRLVRITVDHDGGLPLDLVAQISREVSEALDRADVMGASAYVLEVSSPGVDRPLTRPSHWARATGRLVEVRTADGAPFVGRVLDSDDSAARLETDGAVAVVPFADVTRAVVQVEFSRVDDLDVDDEES